MMLQKSSHFWSKISLPKISFSPHEISEYILKPQTTLSLSEQQLFTFILVLRYERLLVTFALRCIDDGIIASLPASIQRHLSNAELIAERQRQQVYIEAKMLSEALHQESPGYLFLKGAAYSLSGYKAGIGRTFSDIDILVGKHTLDALEKRLLLQGWYGQFLSDYDDKYYRQWAHEIPPLLHTERGTVIDIHHNLVPPVSGRAPDISEFLHHRQKINGFPVLRPIAMLLHSAVHLMFNDDFKQSYRDLFDIKALIEEHGDESFWLDVKELAVSTNFYLELFLALRYCRWFLQVDVPSFISQDVPVSSWQLHVYDFIFTKALAPSHPACRSRFKSTANFFAWCRGHWLKMPMKTLLYHFTVKGLRAVAESLLGKYIFAKHETDKVDSRK